MTIELTDFSIYTILHADDLRRIHEAGAAAERSEKKPWVSGARLLDALLPGRARPTYPTPIYLFGYSGHTDEEIAAAVGVDGLLVDIRFSPRSRRTGFSRAGLQRAYGERYQHVRELGNAAYQSGGIRLADAEAGLQRIDELAASHTGPLFLMCVCADGETCHRKEVGRLLGERGYAVREYAF